MQKSVSRVYVGIGGMGMHTVANTVVRHLDSKVEVTQDMIDSMCDENRNWPTSTATFSNLYPGIPTRHAAANRTRRYSHR